MKTNRYLLNIITILLIVFWLYVALDKLWNLDGFHASLLKQPFPNWWADVLFWLLPVIELGVAVAFIRPLRRPGLTLLTAKVSKTRRCTVSAQRITVPTIADPLRRHLFINVGILQKLQHFFNPLLLSTLLMFVFTVYIGLGVAGAYAKRPCSCASIFRGMSWERHLIINIGLLGISLYGYYLSRKDGEGNGGLKSGSTSFPPPDSDNLISGLFVFMSFQKWFCHTFALFPGRPVLYKPK